jgi:hypothetical protein
MCVEHWLKHDNDHKTLKKYTSGNEQSFLFNNLLTSPSSPSLGAGLADSTTLHSHSTSLSILDKLLPQSMPSFPLRAPYQDEMDKSHRSLISEYFAPYHHCHSTVNFVRLALLQACGMAEQ